MDSYSYTSHTYAELVDIYSTGIYKFCRSLTFCKEDAEDLYQETFMRVLEQMHKVNISINPKGFIYATTLYLWKSWKRKYARRDRLAPTQPLNDSIMYGINTEDSFMKKEETRLIREQVNGLPDKFRIPVLLFYSAEMGIGDIAATLGLPSGTVKSRLHKARKLIEKGLINVGY